MNGFDWIVFFGIMFGIVVYGIWCMWYIDNFNIYFKGSKIMKWGIIGFFVMVMQVSMIIYLLFFGQVYENGIVFIQNYFGLLFVFIFVCVVFFLIYCKLGVYMVYEYFGQCFDKKICFFGVSIFFFQCGF